MKLTNYLKTACPHCGSKDNAVYHVHKSGCVRVRYHLCKCGKKFASHESAMTTVIM